MSVPSIQCQDGAGSGSGTAAASQGWPANSGEHGSGFIPPQLHRYRAQAGARAAGPGGAVDPLHSEPSSIRNVIFTP
jgi:hypothetical protein